MNNHRQLVIDPSDEVTKAFQTFYRVPILEIVGVFLKSHVYDENMFLLRILNLTRDERTTFGKWLSKYYLENLYKKRPFTDRENVLFGISHLLGIHIKANLDKAKEYFNKAAENNEPIALFFLGELFYSYFENHDYAKAKSYYQRAASYGCARAITFLGIYEPAFEKSTLHYANASTYQDSFGKYLLALSTKANYYSLVESAKLGEPKALAALAKYFFHMQQIEKAAYYFFLAAIHGETEAADILIHLHNTHPKNFFISLFHIQLCTHTHKPNLPTLKLQLVKIINEKIASLDTHSSFLTLHACINLFSYAELLRPLRRWAIIYRGLRCNFPIELSLLILSYMISELKISQQVFMHVSDELPAREHVLTMDWRKPQEPGIPSQILLKAQGIFSRKTYPRQIIIAARLGKISYREAKFLLENDKVNDDKKQLDVVRNKCDAS